jgi:hypothetical protein
MIPKSSCCSNAKVGSIIQSDNQKTRATNKYLGWQLCFGASENGIMGKLKISLQEYLQSSSNRKFFK